MPLSKRLAASTASSSTRRQVRSSSIVERSLLTFGISAIAISHSANASLPDSSKTSFTRAEVST